MLLEMEYIKIGNISGMGIAVPDFDSSQAMTFPQNQKTGLKGLIENT